MEAIKAIKALLVKAGEAKTPFAAFYAAALTFFLLGASLGVVAHGDVPRVLSPDWWAFPHREAPLIPPDPQSRLAYALLTILPRNLLVALAAGVLVPWMGQRALGAPWLGRTYVLGTAFAAGVTATPGGLPHGGAYFLAISPVVVMEFLAYALAAWEGARALKEKRFPALGLPALLLVAAALVETAVIAEWL